MFATSLFEAVFNNSPIGNYLLSPTPEATVLAVNDAFLNASGRRREELVGISLFVSFPSNPDDPDDTGESDLRNSLARVVATGKVDTLPAQRYPIRVQLPSGEVVFEERFWDAVSTPIFSDSGNILCISHTTSDVTERVRAVAAIRESEARFRALTHASADVIYRMSPDWSELRQLDGRGFVKDSAGPRAFWLDEYIPADDQQLVHAAIAEAIRNRGIFEVEHRVRRVDGSQGWTLSRAVPMFGDQGEIDEWIGAASDITERKLSEEKLRELDRRKDEFLAMLAHELRNPLAPIGAAAELLQRSRPDEALVRRTSQIIGRQVTHMTGLIDDLLDVSRVTRGLVELDQEPLDVAAIATDAVEQVTPLIQSRRQYLAFRLPERPVLVCGDKKRLVQVLANILNNAAKYTGQEGGLRLDVEADAERVAIRIADNGIGMAPELVARAFDLFAQAERSVDRSIGRARTRTGAGEAPGRAAWRRGDLRKPGPGPGQQLHRDPAAPGRAGCACRSAAGRRRRARARPCARAGCRRQRRRSSHAGHAAGNIRPRGAGRARLQVGARARAGQRAADLRARHRLARHGRHGTGAPPAVPARNRRRPAGRRDRLWPGQRPRRLPAAGFDHHLVKPIDLEKLQALLEGR
jgi:signal transduction histidine kinase